MDSRCSLLRGLRPKQTDLVHDKGQFRSRFHYPVSDCCPATIFLDPRNRHDIISAQHFWTGGLERLGPIMLVMSRIRHAAIVP
jgi:hypothetical protein